MSPSVTHWIGGLQQGRAEAAARLWSRYFARLVRLARRQLGPAQRRASDEEDVALEAFQSFCRRAAAGSFPRLHDRHDLWHLLVTITQRKAANVRRAAARRKRGGGKVRGESALLAGTSSSARPIDRVPDRQPTPELAAMMAEIVRGLFDTLDDDELRRIARLKLDGWTNEEIGRHIDRSVPTVERRLRLIRSRWAAHDP